MSLLSECMSAPIAAFVILVVTMKVTGAQTGRLAITKFETVAVQYVNPGTLLGTNPPGLSLAEFKSF